MQLTTGCRRHLAYGFTSQRDERGEMVGWAVVRLPRRGAFEAVGLRKPLFRPMPKVRPM